MVYKLVRIDISDDRKVELQIGSHIIGRCQFLESQRCDDRRISRNHGKLVVTPNSVTLISIHHNPCFYIRQGSASLQALRRQGIDLHNGDRFGLLPKNYWYELINCSMDTNKPLHDPAQDAAVSSSLVAAPEPQAVGAFGCNKRCHSPVRMKYEGESPNKVIVKTEPGLELSDSTAAGIEPGSAEPSTAAAQVKVEPGSAQPTTSSAQVKVEPGSAQPTTSSVQVKVEPGLAQPASSNVQDSNPGPSVPNNNHIPGAHLRLRCMYGHNCYRKNLAHKAQYSHPNDPDWGTGEKAPCPFGSNCFKTDPRHWRDHEHPPGTMPSSKRKMKARDQLSPVLPKKRAKKAIEPQTYSDDDEEDNVDEEEDDVDDEEDEEAYDFEEEDDDDEEDDPYATDGDSDEWVPDDDDDDY